MPFGFFPALVGDTTPTGLGPLPEIIEGTPGGRSMSANDLGRLFELAQAGNPQAAQILGSAAPNRIASPSAAEAEYNTLANLANRGSAEALEVLKQRNRAAALQRYDQAIALRDRNQKLAERELTAGTEFLSKQANGGTLQQQAELRQQIAAKYPGVQLPDVGSLSTIVAADEDRRIAIKEAEDRQAAYHATPNAENLAAAQRATAQAWGPDAGNKWVDQINQQKAAERADKSSQLKQALDLHRANARFTYTPSEGVRTGGFKPGISLFGRGSATPVPEADYDIFKAKNPWRDVEGYEAEAARFDQAQMRAQSEHAHAQRQIMMSILGVPDQDADPEKTAAAEKAATPAGPKQSTTPAQPDAFSTPEEVREAVRAGRIQVGRPFPYSDGTTRVLTQNGTATIIGRWK